MNPSDFDPHLENLYTQSVGRLMTAEVFDAVSFLHLYEYLCQKSEKIKNEHVVSKQVIAALFSARRSIENAAPYNPQVQENIFLAEKFLMLLEIIAIGESPRDRLAGVPRVI